MTSSSESYQAMDIMINQYFEIEVELPYAEGDTITFEHDLLSLNGSSVPSWTTFDDQTGLIAGTPTDINQADTYELVVRSTSDELIYDLDITIEVISEYL